MYLSHLTVLCTVIFYCPLKTCAVYNWVVTDLEEIYGSYGVPTKFWYNETKLTPDDIVSSPGCPQSIDGYPWLYHGDPPRCFLAGTHGPCPTGQRLLIEKGSNFGLCGCSCLAEFDSSEELQGPDRYVRCIKKGNTLPNEQVFDKLTKACYYMYEQGPCPAGTVIMKVTGNEFKCLPFCGGLPQSYWKKMEERGLCGTSSYVLSAVSGIEANECPLENEHFSKTLNKCVKSFPGKKIMIG